MIEPAPNASLPQGRLALLAAGVLWSLGGVCIKRLPVGAVALTFYRSLFAALTLFLVVGAGEWARRSPRQSARLMPSPRELAVSALLFAVMLVSFVAATRLTTAANAIILQYTAPLYVIGLSTLLLREPPRKADLMTLALCMTGIAVLFLGNFRPEPGPAGQRSTLGLALGAVSGACFGLFTLWQRRLRVADPRLLAGLNNAGAALVLAVALPWMGPVSLPSLAVLAMMGAVQIAIPYTLFAWALQRVPGPEASLLPLVEPVLNPIWVALFVGEKPGPATMAGGALILTALALRYTVWSRR